ncbi:MAG: hypothetical protein ABI601_12445 [bacterium]
MSDDFQKGTLNDSSNVSNHSEFYRGQEYQRAANEPRTYGSPHGTGGVVSFPGGGITITGEHWILQGIASIPFIIVGTALYPVTAVVTVVAGLLCNRLVPLFGAGATWQRFLAYIPMLVVFWISMRWDQRFGQRNAAYRRVRHTARLAVFALLGYWLAGKAFGGSSVTLPRIGGLVAGVALGHWFLMRGEGWREFWHRTLTNFRLRPTH